jgi:lipopolysaccharide export system protein LptA
MPLCGIALAAPTALISPSMLRSFALVFTGLAALAAAPAQAEKADRFKPLNVEADLPGKIDLLNQHVVFNGNVVVTKGTMTIRASRIEVRESPDGYHTAVAFGSPSQHATFRQKRDAADEYIAGDAERLEYDGKSDVIRFVNNASVRRLRGSETSDEISGNLVTYDSGTEVFNVTGGAPATASNPGGRVRAVLTPREGSAAAAESARAASAAASAPAQLRTAPSLGEKK